MLNIRNFERNECNEIRAESKYIEENVSEHGVSGGVIMTRSVEYERCQP